MNREAEQLAEHVVGPVLRELGLWSESAMRLMMGTAAHESLGFTCIKQIGLGPALSFWQIEPATYHDLLDRSMPRLVRTHPEIAAAYAGMVPRRYGAYAPSAHLMRDTGYACATARLLYFRVPRPLPDADDLVGLADYWKAYYNTTLGKGRTQDWLKAYRDYCV